MVFSSIINTETGPKVLCIDLDKKLRDYLQAELQWLKNHPTATFGEFELNTDRARFIDREEYEGLINFPVPKPEGEIDPLDFYEVLTTNGKGNRKYWKYSYARPEQLWFWLNRPDFIGFKVKFCHEIYDSLGLSEKEFFNPT